MVRTLRIQDEGAGEEDFKQAEKALNDIGIKIRDLNTGEMQPFMVTIQQIADKWDTMTEAGQMALGEKLGGVRQLSQVLATIKNMPRINELTEIGRNSQGEGLKAQEIWAESLEARLQSLTNTSQIFWQNFINSDMLKNGISALDNLLKMLTGLQKTFGSLTLTVGLVSNAFLLFTNNPLRKLSEEAIKSGTVMKTLGGSFKRTSTDANVATTGINILGFSFDSTKIKALALQSVLSLGLSAVFAGVTWAISSFAGKLTEADATMDECEAQAKTLSDTLNDVTGEKADINKYEELTKQLQDANLSEEERKQIIAQINDIKSNLSGLEGEYGILLSSNKLSEEEKLDLIKQQYEEKLKQQALDLEENMMSQKKIEQKKTELEMLSEEYSRLEKAINSSDSNGKTQWMGQDIHKNSLIQMQEEIGKKIANNNLEIQKYNSTMEILEKSNAQGSRSFVELDSSIQNNIKTINDATESLNENTQAKQENANVEFKHMTESEAVENIKTATKQYGEANEEANKLRETLAKINENGLSADIITDLAKNYGELGARINDASAVQEFLNQKIEEQVTASQNAYTTMLMNDSQFYQDKVMNNENFTSAFNSYLNSMVTSDGQACDIELSNYTNLLDLKNDLQNRFGDATSQFLDSYINIYTTAYSHDNSLYASLQESKTGFLNNTLGAVAQWASQYVGVNAQSYTKDLQNFQSLSGAKNKVLQDLNAKMQILQDNYNDLLNQGKKVAEETGDPTFQNSMALSNAYNKLRDIKGAIAGANVAFQGLEVSYNKLNTSFNAGSFKGASFNSGKGSGSGSKGSGSKETEKYTEDIENLRDRYYELDTALKIIENDLSNINTLMKNAKGEEKNKLLKEEVSLLNKKSQALRSILAEQEKEKQDYRNMLYSQGGFTFNGNDTIYNYDERMSAIQSWANSFSDADEKKNAQEQYKNLEKMVKEYTSLINDTIPKTKNEIDDIKNQIMSANEEIADSLKDQREEFIKGLEEETEKTKKELNKRKELINRQWDSEDKQDELSEKQDKLNQLEADLASALRTGDESLANNIRQQIAEAQKELNDFIRDSERDSINQRFDDETDKLDEDLENRINMIKEKLGDEEILSLVQQGVTDLSDNLKSIDSATKNVNRVFYGLNDTVNSISTSIGKDWISGLDKVIDKVKQVSLQMPSILGNVGDVNSINPKGNYNLNLDNVNVSVNGTDEDKIRKMCDGLADNIFNQIMNALQH